MDTTQITSNWNIATKAGNWCIDQSLSRVNAWLYVSAQSHIPQMCNNSPAWPNHNLTYLVQGLLGSSVGGFYRVRDSVVARFRTRLNSINRIIIIIKIIPTTGGRIRYKPPRFRLGPLQAFPCLPFRMLTRSSWINYAENTNSKKREWTELLLGFSSQNMGSNPRPLGLELSADSNELWWYAYFSVRP